MGLIFVFEVGCRHENLKLPYSVEFSCIFIPNLSSFANFWEFFFKVHKNCYQSKIDVSFEKTNLLVNRRTSFNFQNQEILVQIIEEQSADLEASSTPHRMPTAAGAHEATFFSLRGSSESPMHHRAQTARVLQMGWLGGWIVILLPFISLTVKCVKSKMYLIYICQSQSGYNSCHMDKKILSIFCIFVRLSIRLSVRTKCVITNGHKNENFENW